MSDCGMYIVDSKIEMNKHRKNTHLDGIISFIAACFCLHGQLVEQHKNAFDTTCCSLSHYNSVTQYNTHTPGNHTQRIIINKYMELSQSLSQTYDPFVSNNYTWFHHFNMNKKSQINGILLWNVNNITQWSCPIENAEFYEVIRAVLSLNGSGRILFETTDDAAHILSIYNEHHNTHNILSLPTNMNITFSANIRLYLPFNSISKSSTAISRNNNIISSTLIQSIDDNINMNVPDYKSTTILPVPTISHNLNVHIHTHEKRLSFATGDKYKDKCIGLKGIGTAACKYNPFCGSETDNHTPGIYNILVSN